MPQNFSQIIAVLFLVAVGFLIGAVLGTWIANREAASKAKKAVIKHQPPEVLPVLSLKEYEEVVGLWRNRADGRLVVLKARNVIDKSTQLGAEQRQQMELAARDWLVWLGLLPARSAKLASAPPTASPSNQARAPQTPQSQAPRSPVIFAPAPAPVSPPSIFDSVAQALAPGIPEPRKPASMVQQINEILQEKLRESAMTHPGVYLSEDAKEGVIVHIGLERYNGIEAVTDPQIKAVIKAAVAQWEKQTEANI